MFFFQLSDLWQLNLPAPPGPRPRLRQVEPRRALHPGPHLPVLHDPLLHARDPAALPLGPGQALGRDQGEHVGRPDLADPLGKPPYRARQESGHYSAGG